MFHTCIKLFPPTPVCVCIYYAYLCMNIYPLAGHVQDLDFDMFLQRGIGHDLYVSYLFVEFHLFIQLIICLSL